MLKTGSIVMDHFGRFLHQLIDLLNEFVHKVKCQRPKVRIVAIVLIGGINVDHFDALRLDRLRAGRTEV